MFQKIINTEIMKKCLFFSLFVIGMTIALSTTYASVVRETSNVVSVKRTGTLLEFVVEGYQDTSPYKIVPKKGLYDTYQRKFRRVGFVDISKTPNLDLIAGEIGLVFPGTKFPCSSWNEDFGEKKVCPTKPVGFPWLKREGLKPVYWYKFDKTNMAFISGTDYELSKYSMFEFPFIPLFWVLMIVVLFRLISSVVGSDEIDDDAFKVVAPFALGISIGFCCYKIFVKYFAVREWNDDILGYEPSLLMLVFTLLINVSMLVALILSIKGKLFMETRWHNRLILTIISFWSLILLGADKQGLMIVTLILTAIYFSRYFIFDKIEKIVTFLEKKYRPLP